MARESSTCRFIGASRFVQRRLSNKTYGILTAGPSSFISRSLTNSGTISGYNFGVSLTDTSVAGGLVNSGNIINIVDRGITIFGGTFGSLLNSGTITATGAGSYGVISTNATYSGAFTNSGSISSLATGISLSGGSISSLLNSGTITTTGAGSTGILSSNVTYNGAVTNSRSISSLATGMSLSGGTVNGDVTNTATGTITTTAATGTNLGIFSSAAITGSLINDGVITGGGGIDAGRAGISTSGGSIGANLANNGTISGYGMKLRNDMIVTPYAGLQHTGVTREAYMETFAPETIFPLIYNPYYERLVTGLAGVKVNGMLGQKVDYQASMGGQFDLSRNANAYGGVSAAPGMESFGIAHGGKWNGLRPSGMAGLFYAPLPNHRLSLNGYANQQAWTSRAFVSGLLGYQVGF